MWKPDRSQGTYSIILFLLAILFFFCVSANLDDAARSRLKTPESAKHSLTSSKGTMIEEIMTLNALKINTGCIRLRLEEIGQSVCKREFHGSMLNAKCCHATNDCWLMTQINMDCSGGNLAFIFFISPGICPFLRNAKRRCAWPIGGERAPPSVTDFDFEYIKHPNYYHLL